MKKVFDAFPLLCWLQEEAGWKKVDSYLTQAAQGTLEIVISAVNVGEIYYRLIRAVGMQKAEIFLSNMRHKVFPLTVVPATNSRIWQAARIKGSYRVSYADAFAVALAKELNVPLVTGDPEILDLPSGLVAIDPLPSLKSRPDG